MDTRTVDLIVAMRVEQPQIGVPVVRPVAAPVMRLQHVLDPKAQSAHLTPALLLRQQSQHTGRLAGVTPQPRAPIDPIRFASMPESDSSGRYAAGRRRAWRCRKLSRHFVQLNLTASRFYSIIHPRPV